LIPGEAHRKRLLSYLADKYASAPPHVVFALGSDSLRFAIDNRSVLAPAVPIVFCCASPATLASIERPSDVTDIVSDFDISKTVDLARRLQPNAREIVVIAGAAPFDLRWAEIARQQLAPHDHVQTRFLVGLPRETVLSEVAQLHRDSTVIMLTIFKDGAGRDFVPADIAAEVASASSAPIYAPYAPWVGRGFVGGHSDTFEDIGTQTGDLILRALDGEDMSKLPPLRSTTQAFRVDARQLERWGLSERSLPPDTIVMFRKASIWQEHRNLVLGVIGVVLVLSAASALLLLQMSKRRRAERELRQSDERLNFAAASAGIGLWQYDPRADHLWSSEHCRAMFGLPADTPLTTEALINAVHPNDRRLALAAVRAATFGHLDDAVSEFRVVDAKGHDRWLEARGRTSVDHHANSIRVSGIFRDITAYKAAQLEAKQLSTRVLNVQDEERQRIAQELHDSTAQHLAAIGLNLMALEGKRDDRNQASKIFKDIQDALSEATRELRAFTYLLHPPMLTKDGLNATLRRYIEGFQRRTGIRVVFRAWDIADRLPPSQQQGILRIVQEALANVHRHASASRVSVQLRSASDRLHLVISDDGRGVGIDRGPRSLDLASLSTGVGLTGMTARVRHFGGTIDIRSGPRGTSIHVVLPIDTKPAQPPFSTHAEPHDGSTRILASHHHS